VNEHDRSEIQHDVYVSLREHIAALRAEDQRALQLMTAELARRLDELNHAHQQAQEKERNFISREAFETHVQRNADDHVSARREVADTARALADKVEATATVTNQRLSNVETFVQRVLGLTLAVPFVTALVVYLLTRG
jgi:hypothetical protein